MRSIRLASVLVLITALAVPQARAGIADSPLPVLSAGATTFHLYSVPGVIRSGSLGSFFSCTSTDTATMQVGVEAFGPAGGAPINDAVATSLSVAPGATVMFGSTAVGISVSTDPGIPSMSKDSARILAASKKLACTAFVADRFNDPPQTSWQLTFIAKTKQKAAN